MEFDLILILSCLSASLGNSYHDEEAGQIPMAFVVRTPGSKISEAQVMDFIERQVCASEYP